MTTADFIIITVLAVLIVGAVFYIVKTRKSGAKCIGCLSCGNCSERLNSGNKENCGSCICETQCEISEKTENTSEISK